MLKPKSEKDLKACNERKTSSFKSITNHHTAAATITRENNEENKIHNIREIQRINL
jgi:hypothetical protein